MRTSITNKIVVIFLIIVTLLSFVLIAFFQLMLLEYQQEYNDDKLNSQMEQLFLRIEEAVESETEKLILLGEIAAEGQSLNSLENYRQIEKIGMKLFDWRLIHCVAISHQQGDFLLKTSGLAGGEEGADSQGEEGLAIEGRRITYQCTVGDDLRLKLYLKEDFQGVYFDEYQLLDWQLRYDSSETAGAKVIENGQKVKGVHYIDDIQVRYILGGQQWQNTNLSSVIYSMVIVCLLLIITSFVLGRYLVGKVSRPLEFLIGEIGNIDTVRIDKEKLKIPMDDEIGMLVDSFNGMKLELSVYMDQLEAQKKKLEILFDHISYSLLIIDEDFVVERVNEQGGCFKSLSQGERAEGRKCYEAFAKRSAPCTECPALIGEGGLEREAVVNQEIFNLAGSPIQYSDGRRVWLIISRTVTKEFFKTRKMIELEKMAQIGKVAAAITHEVKNPIAVIKSGVYYLDKLREDDISDYIFMKEFDETSGLIKGAVAHAEHVTHSLLDFSRDTAAQDSDFPVDVCVVIEQVLMLYSNDIKRKRIKLVRKLDRQPLKLGMEMEILKTIMLNLISNALDMMRGGVLTISLISEEEKQPYLEVEDTGEGIPQENLEHIFEPFFTTKGKKDNAGLGLWIVKNELERAGGSISVNSSVGRGTVMRVMLPMAQRREGNEIEEKTNSIN